MISTFLDLTTRAGCHLTYEATAPTPMVFMLRPRLDDAHLVTVEKRSFEAGLPWNEFQDSHGNLACRSMLKPGHNDIRYDALVAVSSTPENQGAPGALPIPVYELPAELLRYTLPSRYCDSDKLFISHGNTLARSPMGMNGCGPSVTGFTTTSNIATAQSGRISPPQRQLNNATGCAVISPMWWRLFAGRSTCLPAMCRVTFQTLALSSPVTQRTSMPIVRSI